MQDSPSWRTRAILNLDALEHNIQVVRAKCNRSNVMAVIKSDAYGHGLAAVATHIADKVNGFAVATMSEAIECREVQKHKPIVLLSQWWSGDQLMVLAEYDIQPVVHSLEQVRLLEAYRGRPLSIWLKVDTGMNRLGICIEALARVKSRLRALSSVASFGIMSHLASADTISDPQTEEQVNRFSTLADTKSTPMSLLNSAGIVHRPEYQFQWVRPGLMLYGSSPVTEMSAQELGLQPVMALQARVISIKDKMINAGERIGYGGRYTTSRATKIGIVSIGYGDGYPRTIDNRAYVMIHGLKVPLIGRISMDMMTVDLTDSPQTRVGDEVTLWGSSLAVDEVARWASTTAYELLCKVTKRVPRVRSI